MLQIQNMNFSGWAVESNALAIEHAYLNNNLKPGKLLERRLALGTKVGSMPWGAQETHSTPRILLIRF